MNLAPLLPATAIFGLLTVISSCHGHAATPAGLPSLEAHTAAARDAARPSATRHVCDDFAPRAEVRVDDGPPVRLSAAKSARGPVRDGVRMALSHRGPATAEHAGTRDLAWLTVPIDEPGSHEIASEAADFLYWHYADASHDDPSLRIHDAIVSGTVSVRAVARGLGEVSCGSFELTLAGDHDVTVSGTFRHVRTTTPSRRDDELS